MPNLDTVILAAGRGSRLRGVVPQYFKPLMTVDGQALIVQAIRAARAATWGRVVIVAAPGNVDPMVNLLRDSGDLNEVTDIVIQHTPRGPGHAFLCAAPLVRTERAVVLMADNIFDANDIPSVIDGNKIKPEVSIGTRRVTDESEAVKLTRVNGLGTFEGPEINDRQKCNDAYECWVGPLVVTVEPLQADLAVASLSTGEELKLGPFLGARNCHTWVRCNTHDVGEVRV